MVCLFFVLEIRQILSSEAANIEETSAETASARSIEDATNKESERESQQSLFTGSIDPGLTQLCSKSMFEVPTENTEKTNT